MAISADGPPTDLSSFIIRADAVEPDAALRLAYHLECARLGIDPRLGLQSPLHYALEAASRSTRE